MFGDIGAPELLIILAIVVVLFGAGRVAEIGRGLGRGIREFRRELHGEEVEQMKVERQTGEIAGPASKEGKIGQRH